MPKTKTTKKRHSLIIPPGKGRAYSMGRMQSIFKADGAETGHSYCVSEWWLEPNTKGPPVHQHEDDHVFYVLEGVMSIFTRGKWSHLRQGGLVLIPGGTPHTFENRDKKRRAGILSFNDQSGFEEDMPSIVEWFGENPPQDVR